MLTTKNIVCICAIAVSFSLPAIAQTDASTDFEFDKIEVGEDIGWEFNSESESTSVQDNLQELQDFSISDSEASDIRIIQENRRWSNSGDARDYSIETDVYRD